MALQFQTMISVMEIQKERHESQQSRSEMQSPDEDNQTDVPIFVTDESQVAYAIETIKKVMKIQCGPEFEEKWKQLEESPGCGDPHIFLAMQGELITPECLIAELEMNERLDDAIDRSYDRLKKLQADRIDISTPPSTSPLLQHRRLRRDR